MSENLMEKVNAIGERLKVGGVEVGRKMSAGMSSMSFKVKEFFHGQNHADRLVEEATSDPLDEPDWSMNLQIYDLINDNQSLGAAEVVRAIKRRIMTRNNPRIQFLALVLLEALLKNCDNKGFMEVASEKVLDEMVKLIDDPLTVASNRNKALIMIEAWGESTTQLRYLPVFEETYKSLKARGVGFPVRDNESLAPIFTPPRSASAPDSDDIILPHPIRYDIPMRSFTSHKSAKEAFDVARNTIELLHAILSSSPHPQVLRDEVTTSLVQECQRCRCDMQRIAETAGDNEALLFEALNLNDEIQKVLKKYQEFNKPTAPATLATFIPLQPVELEDESAGWQRNEDDDDDGLIRKGSGSSRVELSHDDDMMDDLDEMIFGKRGVGDDSTKPHQSSKHDLISF